MFVVKSFIFLNIEFWLHLLVLNFIAHPMVHADFAQKLFFKEQKIKIIPLKSLRCIGTVELKQNLVN